MIPSADSILFPLHYEVFPLCRWEHEWISSPLWATEMVWPLAFQWFFPTLWSFALHMSKVVLSQGLKGHSLQLSRALSPYETSSSLVCSFTNPRYLSYHLWLFNSVRSEGYLVPHPCVWIGNCLHAVRWVGEDTCLIYFSSLRDQSPELPVVQYLQTVIEYILFSVPALYSREREEISVAVNSSWVQTELCFAYISEISRGNLMG